MILRIFVVLLIASQFQVETAIAQETTTSSTAAEHEESGNKETAVEQPDGLTAEQKEKKRQLEIGMILVGGILILGVFILSLTLLSSRRLKRTIAEGRRPSQPRDELWYLKNPTERPSPEDREPPE